MRHFLQLGLLVALVLIVVSACGGAESAQDNAAQDKAAQARTLQDAHSGPIPPGRYVSDDFKPKVSFTLNKGWRDPFQNPTNLSLLAPERFCPPCSSLDFWVVKRVLKVVSSYEAKPQPAPKDMVSWLRNNPNLDTGKPQETTVGGIKGVQFDATPSRVPQEYLIACIDVCLPLFEDPDDAGQHFSLYEGDKARFIVLEDVEGKQVTIALHSQANKFDEFLPYAQEVLDTVKWEQGG
jgi:hypothetical protein